MTRTVRTADSFCQRWRVVRSPDPVALPEFRELLAARLAELLERYRDDDLPEALWQIALSLVDRALARNREWAWWRERPAAELERLREAIEEAVALAALAVELQAASNEAAWQEGALARELAAEAGRRSRRAQTLPAERARLAKQATQTSEGDRMTKQARESLIEAARERIARAREEGRCAPETPSRSRRR